MRNKVEGVSLEEIFQDRKGFLPILSEQVDIHRYICSGWFGVLFSPVSEWITRLFHFIVEVELWFLLAFENLL